MMELAEHLAKGVVVGFSIAAPVGPIGLLCIRRSLASGPLAGFVSGLGAASADAVYGAIAGFGLTMTGAVFTRSDIAFRLIGGVILLWLGWGTARARPAGREATTGASRAGLAGAFLSTFALTLTNPATILSFAALIGGLGVRESAGAAVLVAGVFLGSALWWLTLAGTVGLLRRRLPTVAMTWINRVSGFVLALFGAGALASLAVL